MPFSCTLNAGSARLVMSFPFLSRTLAWTTTSRVSAVKTATSPCWFSFSRASWEAAPRGAESCARTAQARSRKTQVLLKGRIVSGSKHGFERRQSGRLHQFHLNATIFSIAGRILGAVADHIFIAQFNADLGGDVGQLGQV